VRVKTRPAETRAVDPVPRIIAAWLRPGTQVMEIGFERRRRITLTLEDLGIPAHPPLAWVEPTPEGGAIVITRESGTSEDVGAELLLSVAEHGGLSPDVLRQRDALAKRVGTRARELRKARGLTQDAIARVLGIAPSNYSRLESGRHAPTGDTLVKLAAALRVPLQTLVRV
jgi:DNA-binding XRE family transcriptional regulator